MIFLDIQHRGHRFGTFCGLYGPLGGCWKRRSEYLAIRAQGFASLCPLEKVTGTSLGNFILPLIIQHSVCVPCGVWGQDMVTFNASRKA